MTKPIDLSTIQDNGTINRQRQKERTRWWED